jgi:hypothetical protein
MKYNKEDAHAVKLGVVLGLKLQSNNEKIGRQVETAIKHQQVIP